MLRPRLAKLDWCFRTFVKGSACPQILLSKIESSFLNSLVLYLRAYMGDVGLGSPGAVELIASRRLAIRIHGQI